MTSPNSEGSATTAAGSSTDGEKTLVSISSVQSEDPPERKDVTPKGKPDVDALEETSTPTAEDIFESTTSYAKPLSALERLRRLTRTYYGPPSVPKSTSNPLPSRHRRTIRGGGGGVGMMDVFAVMAQINEQLDAAPNLNVFLKVAVGVIKDLTQFHRVLVYQFDDMWNGKVVAELVDWSQTHDLFKGLHFPAGDIPAQVSNLLWF